MRSRRRSKVVPCSTWCFTMARGADVRSVLIDGRLLLDEGKHTWVDREALLEEIREVVGRQCADERWRHMAEVGEHLAKAWDAYPKPVFAALPPLPRQPWLEPGTMP